MLRLFVAAALLTLLSSSNGQVLQRFAKPASFCMPTEPQMEGPYYVPNSPMINGTLCQHTGPSVFRLYMSGQIVSAEDCTTPVPAVIEAWQANEVGNYSQFNFGDRTNFDCRRTINTDQQGRYDFQTTFPGRYSLGGSYRPAHVHFKITPLDSQYGGILTTQVYFEHDVYLGEFGQYSTVVLPLINRNDFQSFETQWFVYIKKGGNGEWEGGMDGSANGGPPNGGGGPPPGCPTGPVQPSQANQGQQNVQRPQQQGGQAGVVQQNQVNQGQQYAPWQRQTQPQTQPPYQQQQYLSGGK
uniref:Intradiol ring-cleavage dioxygenases domain-containing protein n=1 Tax=Plectus sambesii TaxID=2011161 RepID=A0A914WCC6_9BILA